MLIYMVLYEYLHEITINTYFEIVLLRNNGLNYCLSLGFCEGIAKQKEQIFRG